MPLHKNLHPPPLKPRQPPPLPILPRPSQPSHLLEILLELGEHHAETRSITFLPNPVLLPFLLGLERGKCSAVGQNARREHSLPLEDLEREARAHRADEEERRVGGVDDVLVQIRHSVVPDLHRGQEGQRPGVARAEDEVVDIGHRGAVDEVHGAAPLGGGDVGYGRFLHDRGVVEGGVAEVAICFVAEGYGVNGELGGGGEVVGDVCAGDGGAYNDDFLLGRLVQRVWELLWTRLPSPCTPRGPETSCCA